MASPRDLLLAESLCATCDYMSSENTLRPPDRARCLDCTRPAVPGFRRCEPCKARQRGACAVQRAIAKATAKCRDCGVSTGDPRDRHNPVRCPDCMKRRTAYKRPLGSCARCGKPCERRDNPMLQVRACETCMTPAPRGTAGVEALHAEGFVDSEELGRSRTCAFCTGMIALIEVRREFYTLCETHRAQTRRERRQKKARRAW